MPSSAAFHSDVHRALRHYERAIAALHGEDYHGIPPALRTDLVERLGRERDALLRRMAAEGLLTKRDVPAADTSSRARRQSPKRCSGSTTLQSNPE